jgi:lactate dehydrogenase-like 2-hydroxyacid dehydrogenase
MIERGDWQVSEIARNAFDLEGKVVGTIGAGRIGYRVLQRLVPFDCKELLYYDYSPLPAGNYSTFTTALRFCLIICIPQLLLSPSRLAESQTLK